MAERDTSDPAQRITEQANPRTREIDRLPLGGILALLLDEDAGVADAVRSSLPAIEQAGERLLASLKGGGRWFNLGSGTSGRIGVLDAAEIPPTYGLDPDRVQAILAGGAAAMSAAVEGAEDDPVAAARELEARGFAAGDVLLAISASGGTRYVLGGVRYAREKGAQTIGLTCAPDSELAQSVDCPIVVVVGPEAITGSTRMKGGLAQKMVLQMLSTAVMVRMGRVRGNLMAALDTKNAKLFDRAVRILMELTQVERAEAERVLKQTSGSVADALATLEESE